MKKLFVVFILLGSLGIGSPTFAYSVKDGDTMTQIANKCDLSLAVLAEMNPHIRDLNFILGGQTIHTTKTKEAQATVEVAKSKVVKEEKFVKGNEAEISLAEDEIDLLARIVRAEAQTEPFLGKVAVADVVLNRVESPQFPSTVEEVIYAPGQFQPVSNGEIYQPADEESIEAVYTALSDQTDVAKDSLFFYNPDIATSRWLDTKETTVVIGDHVFKK